MASAKHLASSAISASSNRGIVCPGALRFGSGRFFCEMSVFSSVEGLEELELDEEGLELEGKKHLKMPSACHFVAWVKFTQTSMRPGRLKAGSRRSIWLVVAKRRLRVISDKVSAKFARVAGMKIDNAPTLRRSDAIEAVQEATQTQSRSIRFIGIVWGVAGRRDAS